ncbi:hypothetical protein D3C72_1561610 [compost metagenome]
MNVVFLDPRGRGDEIVERHRHRGRRRAGERGAEQEVVPDIGELPDDRDDDDRAGGRQENAAEDLEEARAVDLRRSHQLGREGLVIVAKIERGEAEAVDHMHHDQAPDRSGEAQNAEDAGHRDQHDLERDEARQKQHAEEDVGTGETPLGQHVTIERADDRRDRDGRHHHQDGIDEERLQARRLHADLCRRPGRKPGLERQGLRQVEHAALADLVERLQRVGQHHVERQQRIERKDDQHRVDQRPRQAVVRDDVVWAGGAHERFPPRISE